MATGELKCRTVCCTMSVCCSSDGKRLRKAAAVKPQHRFFFMGTCLKTSSSVISIVHSYEQTKGSFLPKINHTVQIKTAECVKGLQNYKLQGYEERLKVERLSIQD